MGRDRGPLLPSGMESNVPLGAVAHADWPQCALATLNGEWSPQALASMNTSPHPLEPKCNGEAIKLEQRAVWKIAMDKEIARLQEL